MRIRRFALLMAVLALVLMPRVGQSQGSQPDKKKSVVSAGKVYPNPSNPESRWQFQVGGYPACEDGGKQYRVTVKIFNILAQVIKVPQLVGGSGGVAGGQKLDGVMLPCGEYIAYWNGKYLDTTREAASGVYLWAAEVDGQRVTHRATVAK